MGGYNHPNLDTPANKWDHRAVGPTERIKKKGALLFFAVRPSCLSAAKG
jgi:hypothetical protein